MNNQYFFKHYHFFYITHLALFIMTTISLFPSLAISQQVSAEHLNAIAPHQGSKNDSMKSSASKEILAMGAAIAVNHELHRLLQKFSPYTAATVAPVVGEQTLSHLFSIKSSKTTSKQLTDTRGYDPFISAGEFNQKDWDDRRELAKVGLRNLQNSLIDQELEKYIEKAGQRARNDIEYSRGKGYTYDPKNNRVNIPGGKSIAVKDIFTAKGFKTLGLSSKKFKEFKKQQKKFEQKAISKGNAKIANIIKSAKNKAKKLAAKAKSTNSSSYDPGNPNFKGIRKDRVAAINGQNNQGIGGHYATSSFNSDWRPPSFQDILNQQKLLKKGGINSDAEGELTTLSKRYGNDLIGLSSNNIFDMIHRQYLRKRLQLSDTNDLIAIE